MYATPADMIARFGQQEMIDLSAPGEQSVNEGVLTQALSDASALIDSYVSGRYTVPLSPIPVVLSRTACSVARYYLYDDQVKESVERSFKDATRYLQEISKGTVKLGLSQAGELSAQTESLTQMSSDKPIWSRKTSVDFI